MSNRYLRNPVSHSHEHNKKYIFNRRCIVDENITVSSILRGYTVDRANIQSVGNMTVIPIISDKEFTNVADVTDVVFSRDRSYNQLEFKNNSGRVAITIHGWSIIEGKQQAQDRTLPYVHLVKGHNSKILPANCIQSRQSGHFDTSRWNQEDFMILPPSLKGLALKKSTHMSAETGALWSDLGKWVSGVDCEHEGLTAFYSKFQDKLDIFVAEFEPVQNQLGAITLINNRVVSVDIMPKYSSWQSVWRTLIRDSYGAEAIRMTENEGAYADIPTIALQNVNNLADLVSEYNEVKKVFYDELESKFVSISNQDVSLNKQDQANELSLFKLSSNHYSGQAVFHGDHCVYLSFVISGATPRQQTKKLSSLRNTPYSESAFAFRG